MDRQTTETSGTKTEQTRMGSMHEKDSTRSTECPHSIRSGRKQAQTILQVK